MDFRTTRRDISGANMLALEGAVDLAATPRLHDALRRLVDSRPSTATLVVDVDGVSVLDDAALGLLLGAAASARSSGRTLRVVCSDERLRRRLNETRFDLAVTVAATWNGPVADTDPEVS